MNRSNYLQNIFWIIRHAWFDHSSMNYIRYSSSVEAAEIELILWESMQADSSDG